MEGARGSRKVSSRLELDRQVDCRLDLARRDPLEQDSIAKELQALRGELDKGIALGGEVAGRIDSVRPVADVIRECADDCLATLADLAARYPAPPT